MDLRNVSNWEIPEGVVIKVTDSNGVVIWKKGVQPDYPNILNNEIWYTSTDGNIVELYKIPTNNTLISNSYENGVGKIVFEKDLTEIGNWGFRNSNLNSITIPRGVTSISDYVFYGCTSLTSINLPNSVTSIGYNVFDGCTSLTSINLSNLVGQIPNNAFRNCSSLISINLSNSVGFICQYAFDGCTSLQSITCLNLLAPQFDSDAFRNVGTKVSSGTPKILHIPLGAIDYDKWLTQLGEDWIIEYI